MAAAKRKLAVNVLVRDPKTDQPVFLQAGQELPSGLSKLVAEENLVPKKTASSKKKDEVTDEPAEAPVQVPEPETNDILDDAPVPAVTDDELDSGESFDTE